MCCGGGLKKENFQCGVVCALRIREATSFSGERGVFMPDRGGGADANRYESQVIGLNLLIFITVWLNRDSWG